MRIRSLCIALWLIGLLSACTRPVATTPTVAPPTAAPPTVAPPTATPAAALLPAPLYMIDTATAQVVRVEPDAEQVTRISNEAEPVLELAVAAAADRLFYLVGDPTGRERTLVLLDGGERRELLRGQIAGLAATPDGEQVVFHFDRVEPGLIAGPSESPKGIWTTFADGREPSLVQADDLTDGSSGSQVAWGYFPIGWSPDGTTLALFAYDQYISGIPGGELVMLRANEQPVRGPTCCEQPVWSADSRALYAAGGGPGPDLRYGLYRSDAADGTESELIAQGSSEQIPLVFAPYQATDGRIYALVELAPTQGFDWDYPFRPALVALAADGSLTRLGDPLTATPVEALWAVDGSGVVVATVGADGTEQVIWQTTTQTMVRKLPVTGRALAWAP